jgi:hypothetical protein
VPIGNLVATVVLLVLSRTLSAEAFLAWGWRVGFWLSVVIVAIGYYIRTKISDAPIFLEAQKEAEEQKHDRYGVFEVVRRYRAACSPRWVCASRRTSCTTSWSPSRSRT